MSFEIISDSCCNLTREQIAEYNVHILPLVYIVNGKEYFSYSKDETTTLKEYYDLMRQKTPITTSCANKEHCEPIIEEVLKSGKDVLYIGFSSAMSATFNVVSGILEKMRAKYPNQKIYYVDSLCAAYGQGLLVVDAAMLRAEGASIDVVYDFVQDNKYKLCHLFTVDTLYYLHKGGRVKKSAMLIAGTLKIKPILHLDNAGQITPLSKVFGRKFSLNAIAKRIAATIVNPEKQTIFICHGDCLEDAEFLKERISELIPVKGFSINCIELVVGSHSGPGTIAAFYYAEGRE